MNSPILLTISILISNRPNTVRKCLESIQPILRQVPSELILVDTGCGEQVRAVIEEYTDTIVDFPWCRDFAKARNAGLERARGKWFLYLDDDEWFDDVSDIVRFFRTGEYRVYGLALYTMRNYTILDGSEYTELLVSRMIRLEPDIRFIHRIHECFNRAPGRARRLRTFVHHYGYVFQSDQQMREHAGRNISLMLEEYAEHPLDMRNLLQLVQGYRSMQDNLRSLEFSLEGIARAEQGPVEEDYCLASICANAVNCYMELNRYDEAIQKGELYLQSARVDKMAKALIAGRLVTAYADKEDYGRCLEHAGYYWSAYQDYLKNENSYVEFETPVTNTCFHDRRRTPILGDGLRAAVRDGRADLAWQWFQAMNWKWDRILIHTMAIRGILERMPEASEEELAIYVKMCNTLLEREDLRDFIQETVLELCGRRAGFEEKSRAMSAYRDLTSEHWFWRLIRFAAGEPMPFLAWEKVVSQYFHRFETSEWAERFGDTMEQDSLHALAWRAACFARRASRKAAQEAAAGRAETKSDKAAETGKAEPECPGDIGCIREDLAECARCRRALCERIYRPETVRDMPDILPPEYRGAYAVAAMLEKAEAGQYADAADAAREAAGFLPGLADALDHCVKKWEM